ncbi:hypothetical protein D9M68_901080 [compost metagenome]
MKQLNDYELNTQIDSFLARKHREYPELGLRSANEMRMPAGRTVMDKFFHSLSSIKLQLSR